MVAMAAILDFRAIFDLQVIPMLSTKFRVKIGPVV